MSEPDNFLSRWSRRKLDPSQQSGDLVAPETKQPTDAQAGGTEPETPVAAAPTQDQAQEAPFNPASLPPIESITAGTDIRDFLKPGVPLSLSRAALRRAWTSDPAIRDFIGIAENQWDFTDDSIPGFGPLDPADVPRLLARIIGSSKDSAEASAALTEGQPEAPQSVAPGTPTAKGETDATDESEHATPAPTKARLASGEAAEPDASRRNKENDATQNSETDRKLSYAQLRNGHGSALPD